MPNGLSVSLEIDEALPSRPEIEIAIFRIFQELMTNILRHAQAEHVSIELYEREGNLLLAVEDDGLGFTPDRDRGGGRHHRDAGARGPRQRLDPPRQRAGHGDACGGGDPGPMIRIVIVDDHDMHSRAALIRYAIRKAIISLEGP